MEEDEDGKSLWVVVHANDVPDETGLTEYRFTRPADEPSKPYVTPAEPDSSWKKPGPAAGPFYVYPGDGSKVTLLLVSIRGPAGTTERGLIGEGTGSSTGSSEKLLHSTWKKDRDYLAPPKRGELAEIDAALVVAPPKGFEIGYVPIATRQELNAGKYRVQKPPSEMKLDSFYAKYVDASGYPVVSSARVDDYALKEAAYLIDMMLAKRPDLRQAMVASGSRMIVMAHDEYTTDIPEHSHLSPKDYWDVRARGLGGSLEEPVCSCAGRESAWI